MESLFVSIIIPTYNVGAYIGRCLQSVLEQTFDGRIECLVVDDCCTDNSIDIAKNSMMLYQERDITFKILHHAQNQGLSAARNTGLKAAMGDYVFFLDSDDALQSDCLKLLSQPIQNDPTVELVMANRKEVPDGYSSSPVVQKTKNADVKTQESVRDYYLSNSLSVSACNKLIRRDLLINNQLFFKEGLLHEDLLWMHYVIKYLRHLYVVSNVTYTYYRRPQSITTGICEEERARHKGMIYEEIAQNFTAGEEAKEAAHYLPGFCSLLRRFPNIPSCQRTAVLFKKALSDGHHTKEKLLLSLVVIFSKTGLGRRLVSTALGIRRFLIKIIVSISS